MFLTPRWRDEPGAFLKRADRMGDLLKHGDRTSAEWLLLDGTSVDMGRCATTHVPLVTSPAYEVEARCKFDIPPQRTDIALPVIPIFAGSEVGYLQLGLLDAQSLSCQVYLLLKTFGSIQEMAIFFP